MHIPNGAIHAPNPPCKHSASQSTCKRHANILPRILPGIKHSLKLRQRLARTTALNSIQTTRDKHFLTVLSQDPGCTLRGTVHLLQVTPTLKQNKQTKKKGGGRGERRRQKKAPKQTNNPPKNLTKYYIAGKSFICSCSSTLRNIMPAVRKVIIKSVRLAKAIFHWAETSYYTAREAV